MNDVITKEAVHIFRFSLLRHLMPVLLLVGSVFHVNGQTTTLGGLQESGSDYRIGAGDVLQIVVLKHDLLSQPTARVSNDGTLRLPMMDQPVRAKCFTETELARDLETRYKKFILNPQVYVVVKEFNANPVTVVGAVASPGRFQLQRPTRLLEIITKVNGLAPVAGSDLQIIRTGSVDACTENSSAYAISQGEGEIISLSLADVFSGSDATNPYLMAGDLVRVNQAEVKQAYIVGNVKAATTVNLKEPVTLSRAIAMAGGISTGGQMSKIKISRQLKGTVTKTDMIVDLKAINNRQIEDVLLESNDIVDVPGPSGFRKGFGAIIRAIITTGTRGIVPVP